MPKGEKGSGRPYLRGKIWWIKYFVSGVPKYESSGSTKKSDAVRLLNQRRAEIDTGSFAPSSVTVDDLLKLYVSDMEKQKRKSLRDAKRYVRDHLSPRLGQIKASELTTQHIDRYIQSEQSAGQSDASINRYLSALRRSYNLAWQATPPLVSRVPKIEMLSEDNVREGFLEHPDYARMLHYLPDHQKLVLVIGYHLGLRRGEILQLRWDQLDWLTGVIRLERKQTKSKQPRIAPLYGEPPQCLQFAFQNRGDSITIVSYHGHSVSEVKRAWKTARQRLGCPVCFCTIYAEQQFGT
jgi:integrase